MSDADVLGFPAWDSSVRTTNPFWNAVAHKRNQFSVHHMLQVYTDENICTAKMISTIAI
jgi:hypothetical protein